MSQTRIKIRKDKKSARNRRRGAKYWMAVGTVAAYTTFGSDAVFKVYAQQDRPAPPCSASRPDPGFDRAPLRHSARDPGFGTGGFREDGAIQRELCRRTRCAASGRLAWPVSTRRKRRCRSCLPAPASAIT